MILKKRIIFLKIIFIFIINGYIKTMLLYDKAVLLLLNYYLLCVPQSSFFCELLLCIMKRVYILMQSPVS